MKRKKKKSWQKGEKMNGLLTSVKCIERKMIAMLKVQAKLAPLVSFRLWAMHLAGQI
jgi:hypothetical protein